MIGRRGFINTLGTLSLAAAAYEGVTIGESSPDGKKNPKKPVEQVKHADTGWFMAARCGAFTHYLA